MHDHFARRYTAAWCSANPEAVAAFFAPGGALTINNGEPAVGPQAIAASARGFMTAFPDLQVFFDALAEAPGGRIVYRWTLTGTNTGPGGTGRAVRMSGYEEWLFDENGLIADSLGHFDAGEYDRQLRGEGDVTTSLPSGS